MNILFVGNSFTYFNHLPLLFKQMAEDNGHNVKVFAVTHGGRRLWENLDIDDDTARLFHATINTRHYDYVFLQEQSCGPILEYDKFQSAIGRIKNLLEGKADHIILYETWGYHHSCPLLEQLGLNFNTMPEQLAEAYRKVADAYGLYVSHAGTNFTQISRTTDMNLYVSDGFHPNYIGSTLAMLTHYAGVFGEFPTNFSSIILSQEIINVLRKVVMKAPEFD